MKAEPSTTSGFWIPDAAPGSVAASGRVRMCSAPMASRSLVARKMPVFLRGRRIAAVAAKGFPGFPASQTRNSGRQNGVQACETRFVGAIFFNESLQWAVRSVIVFVRLRPRKDDWLWCSSQQCSREKLSGSQAAFARRSWRLLALSRRGDSFRGPRGRHRSRPLQDIPSPTQGATRKVVTIPIPAAVDTATGTIRVEALTARATAIPRRDNSRNRRRRGEAIQGRVIGIDSTATHARDGSRHRRVDGQRPRHPGRRRHRSLGKAPLRPVRASL